MKSFTFFAVCAMLAMVATARPVARYYYYPYGDTSSAYAGDGGDGGGAYAQGANIIAGAGGPAVADTDKNINFLGAQKGGDGYALVTAANGAAGIVKGYGKIDGDFDNDADGGDGGDGGDAKAY